MKKPSIKISATLLGLLSIWGAFLVSTTSAASCVGVGTDYIDNCGIYRQSSYSGAQSTGSVWQYLGTGLSGDIDHVGFVAGVTASSTGFHPLVTIIQCNVNNFADASCVVTSQQEISYTPQATSTIQVDFATSTSMDPTKYYFLGYNPNSAPTLTLGGTVLDSWTGGDLYCVNLPGYCSGLKDLSFYLGGTQTVTNLATVHLFTPEQATTTFSTIVPFYFSYHNPVEFGYTQYVLQISDYGTQFASIATNTISLYGSITSGDGYITKNVTLTAGHYYYYEVFLCSSIGLFGDCANSAKFTFAVVNGSVEQGIFDYAVTASGLSTTSTGTIGQLGQGIRGVVNSIADKVPFAYFVALINAWSLVSADATSSFPILDINFASLGMGSTTSMGNVLPDVKLDKDAILKYMPTAVYNTMYSLEGVAFWLALAYYFYRRIPGLFRSA